MVALSLGAPSPGKPSLGKPRVDASGLHRLPRDDEVNPRELALELLREKLARGFQGLVEKMLAIVPRDHEAIVHSGLDVKILEI